jgi:hypothetical protein
MRLWNRSYKRSSLRESPLTRARLGKQEQDQEKTDSKGQHLSRKIQIVIWRKDIDELSRDDGIYERTNTLKSENHSDSSPGNTVTQFLQFERYGEKQRTYGAQSKRHNNQNDGEKV